MAEISMTELFWRRKAAQGDETAKQMLCMIEQRNTPERIDCDVMGVNQCEQCKGRKLAYRAIFIRPHTLQMRYVCTECGYGRALIHTDNIDRRGNSATANWRKSVLKLRGSQCYVCGTTENLEVHHIIPWAKAPELRYDVNNGLVLCKAHHRQVPTVKNGEVIQDDDG